MCERCAFDVIFNSVDLHVIEDAIFEATGNVSSKSFKYLNKAIMSLYVLNLHDINVSMTFDEERLASIRESGMT